MHLAIATIFWTALEIGHDNISTVMAFAVYTAKLAAPAAVVAMLECLAQFWLNFWLNEVWLSRTKSRTGLVATDCLEP